LTALLYYSKPVQNLARELNTCISLSRDWAKQRENKKNRTLPSDWMFLRIFYLISLYLS